MERLPAMKPIPKLILLMMACTTFSGNTLAQVFGADGVDGSNFSNTIGHWNEIPPGAVGGEGGAAIVASGSSTIGSGAGYVGGTGGNGGSNNSGYWFETGPAGAPGGEGGSGVLGTGFTLTNNGSVFGGTGGIGGGGSSGD